MDRKNMSNDNQIQVLIIKTKVFFLKSGDFTEAICCISRCATSNKTRFLCCLIASSNPSEAAQERGSLPESRPGPNNTAPQSNTNLSQGFPQSNNDTDFSQHPVQQSQIPHKTPLLAPRP